MTDDKGKEEAVVVQSSPLSRLSLRERAAYNSHLKDKDPPLAPSTQAGMFELYLNGMSLEEIQRSNKDYRLGAIVRSFIDGDWEEKRMEYVRQLLSTIASRVAQVQSESVRFISDLLAVAHKQNGEKLRKYLKSGDEKDLGGFSIQSITVYRQVAETLIKITGTGQQVPQPPPADTQVEASTSSGVKDVQLIQPRPGLPSKEAAEILARLQSPEVVE